MRQVGYEDLNDLCRGIKKSFVYLETSDSYGTEVELPHLAKWRRGEPDLPSARIVSEPISDCPHKYQ